MFRHIEILALFCISEAVSDCSDGLRNLLNTNSKESLENGCGSDWKYFSRPSGGWCMKIFPGNLAFDAAEIQCREHNATLSGIQNSREADFIQTASLLTTSASSGSVLIGARRAAKCVRKSITPQCTKATSFIWTDKSTTGAAGFLWALGQPDNAGGKANCALFFASSIPNVEKKFAAKTLDDVTCVAPSVSGKRGIIAFVCGKKTSK